MVELYQTRSYLSINNAEKGGKIMRVILCDTYEEVSAAAERLVESQIVLKPNCVLGLATGSTPVGMYKKLVEKHKAGELDFSGVVTFNLDEYYPLSADNNQSYHYFMNENLFSHINVKPENIHIPNGEAADCKAECDEYERMIEEAGGIDLQILGIGQNGHIGFNEPDAKLNTRTHVTDLTESTIKANSRFFDSIEDVPRKALTMGIATILKSKKIILLASGANKHNVVAALLQGNLDTEIPASMLNVHPDVTLICDKDAYYSRRIGIDIGGTETKFGVLDDNNKLIYRTEIPTNTESAEALADGIAAKCREIMKEYSITGIGVGTAGLFRGDLVTAVNLPLKDTDLSKLLSDKIGLSVCVSNDANCAALGETLCGAGKNADNLIMVTLGTGIGGGIIIDNKIYRGCGSAGEVGHMSIEKDGKPCGCGKKGCWEKYASAQALVEAAEKAADGNPESILARLKKENGGKLNGKLIAAALRDGCTAARQVIDTYAFYLADGIDSLASIFAPDMFVLSGGITNMGELLLEPVRKQLKTDIPVEISELKNDAGIIGAAMLR